MKIAFIGTPEFSAIILKKLIEAGYPPFLVITGEDKPLGRKKVITPPPVKKIAEKNNILTIQPKDLSFESFSSLAYYDFDLFILASYGKILSKEFLSIPKHGSINVHPSLLPRYRGPSPVQSTILSGDKETGVSIIKMVEKIDAGPILIKGKIEIINRPTYQELHNQLAHLGAELLIKVIPSWIQGKIKPQLQNNLEVSYSKILKKEDGKIDWKNERADYLERKVRAFYPWPGCYTFWQNNQKLIKVKILKSDFLKSENQERFEEGKVLKDSFGKIIVQTKKDFLIIKKIQVEGKKETAITEFLKGNKNFINSVLK